MQPPGAYKETVASEKTHNDLSALYVLGAFPSITWPTGLRPDAPPPVDRYCFYNDYFPKYLWEPNMIHPGELHFRHPFYRDATDSLCRLFMAYYASYEHVSQEKNQ